MPTPKRDMMAPALSGKLVVNQATERDFEDLDLPAREAVEIRVRGRVQGVGFRPAVWRHARNFALDGEVLNDASGVLVRAAGARTGIAALVEALRRHPPPLARIDTIEISTYAGPIAPGFRIARSLGGAVHTQIAPDAAICEECDAEICDPQARRYRYPLTNCTHCGPRLTVTHAVPYDRANTTMAGFAMCADCAREYGDPEDRRFHAEPTACPVCGPKLRLVDFAGRDLAADCDPIAAAASRIAAGDIVAVKGLGGYQLACDATNEAAVARLRARKRRDRKPFALMARDLDSVARYCAVTEIECDMLRSSAAPIVLMAAGGPVRLPGNVAPGQANLGFMLPTTPLHCLLLRDFGRPLVMTSGNLSDEPQIIDDREARENLSGVADCLLVHDREIANRMDDSVVRAMGGTMRLIRRARGFAPEAMALPPGFESASDILAMGGELKSTFCLVKDGLAILSQHQGDLEQASAFDGYCRSLDLYRNLFAHVPQAIAVDLHPDYLSSKRGRAMACADGLPLFEIQHHHGHAAACLAENLYPLAAPPVLAIVLDGLGFGTDGHLWGGEFLLCDYRGFERLAMLRPVAMAGGVQAIREPWRNLYAHLLAALGWDRVVTDFAELEMTRHLLRKPLATVDTMVATNLNAPCASSCGRLFDAVAAALGLCADRQSYEGEAASALEALAAAAGQMPGSSYPFAVADDANGVPCLDPAPMWQALLRDLAAGEAPAAIAARFHAGLSEALVRMATMLAGPDGSRRVETIALSGGCFQNRILFEAVQMRLEGEGFTVLGHARVPANDGGLALGQAVIAAARMIEANPQPMKRTQACASAFPAAS